MATGKNRGEWSEIYIFLKLISDRKIYAADDKLNKIPESAVDVLDVVREENEGEEYRYYTGDEVVIKKNGVEVRRVNSREFKEEADKVWDMITSAETTTFDNAEIADFLESIYVTSIAAPAVKKSEYFGGTVDIQIETRDAASGRMRELGFSCKSDIFSASTLFNASGDNTNFEYELVGDVNDDVMNEFNSIFREVTRKGETKLDVAVSDRMMYLKEKGIDVKFVAPVGKYAAGNMIFLCDRDTPAMVGEMLKFYYCDREGKKTTILEAVDRLDETDPAHMAMEGYSSIYRKRVSSLLFEMFRGMRFSKPCDKHGQVNGGYIEVKREGEIVAYHSCFEDEFRDFLVRSIRFETPSCKRHKFMDIYKKEDGKYYIKFALQLRFDLKR